MIWRLSVNVHSLNTPELFHFVVRASARTAIVIYSFAN
jgi:hypothetical protein